jgi:flagellar biosynthetic protein FlhB
VLTPKWERLDPVKGVQRIISWRGTLELLKALVKITVTSVLVWSVLTKRMPEIMALTGAPVLAQLHSAGRLLAELGGKIGVFFLGLGVLDLLWQRYDFEKKLRMSKQEVRDELRQTEGDPLVKYKRRARHRKLAATRVAAEVARADVVTTNPTRYAVALRYDARRMKAPRVVAKGRELWAKLIVRVARRHGVPVIPNPPLARALYAQVEVGREVPAALYRAVAEILAAIYRMRNRLRRKA